MKDTLQAGIKHTHKYIVRDDRTVPHLFPEAEAFKTMPEVFATGFLVALMEWACIEAMAPHLEPGEGSVGIKIDMTHTAPTPPGMEVTVDVDCVEVDGRRTVWEIEARDEVETIGKARHERFTVSWDRFNAGVAEKAGNR
jgi:fluoroacetyl-CoA thioesterase